MNGLRSKLYGILNAFEYHEKLGLNLLRLLLNIWLVLHIALAISGFLSEFLIGIDISPY